jgi:hypothetical protein
MHTLKQILKTTGFILSGLLFAFFVYANWEEPPLSDRLNLKPIALAVFTLDHEITSEDSTNIAQKLSTSRGVTAATVNKIGKTVSVTYHADETSEIVLKKMVERQNLQAQKLDFATFKGPQCPVPSEYIDFVLNVKKAFCFR